ncbi:MAG: class I SAM-dependent methyltransferase [Desulfotomaculum sp.]|nr:class I SAM-dependent methyltransferase [Desulfotomaculum sp.]
MSKSCWLCGSISETINDVKSPIYYHCPVCDLIFIDDEYILSPREEKKRYTLHENTRENQGYVKFLTGFINEAVKPYMKNIKTGLDFGCGPGPVLSQLLTEMGIIMEYYDPYFYPGVYFSYKKYDLITCTEVLEHVRKPREVINFFQEHLNSRGILAVMTLFHNNNNFKKWWYRLDPTHICFYSPRTFHWIAKKYNLEIKYINDKNICVMQNNV